MAEPSNRQRWAEVAIGALAGILVGIGVLAWWALRGGTGVPPGADAATSPIDTALVTTVAEGPNGVRAGERDGTGPLIGAFAARIDRRLGTRDLRTAPLPGPVTIRLRRIVWRESDGRTFAEAPIATAQLDLSTARAGDVVITNAMLTEPFVRLREAGGAWNYEEVLADLLEADEPNGDPRPSAERTVLVRGLTVTDGVLDVEAETSFRMTDLDARFDRLVFSGPDVPAPVIDIAQASATLIRADTIAPVVVAVDDARVRLLEDRVAFRIQEARYDGIAVHTVDGSFSSDRPGFGIEATGRATDLQLAELEPFLPDTVQVSGTADFAFAVETTAAGGTRLELSGLNVASEGSRIAGEATIRLDPEGFALETSDLRLDPLRIALIERFTGPLPYSGSVRGAVFGPAGALRFDLAANLRTAAGDTFPAQLEGVVDLAGARGLRGLTANLESVPLVALQPVLPGLGLRGTVSGTVSLDGGPGTAPMNVSVRLNLAAGIVTLNGIVDLTGSQPAYDLTGRLVGVEPNRVIERPLPPVILTADYSLVGRGTDPATAEARLALAGRFTGWRTNPDDTVVVRAAIDDGIVSVDRLRLALATLEAEAEGEWRAIEPVMGSIRYSAAIESLEPWAEYVPALADTALAEPVVAGSILAEGTVTGRFEAPQLAGTVEAEGVDARGWSIERLEAAYAVALGDSVPDIMIDAEAAGIQSSAAGAFTTASLDLRLNAPTFTLELLANQERGGIVEISADGTMPAAGPRELVLRRAVVDLVDGRWTLTQPASFDWAGTEGLVVGNFEMRDATSQGRILLDGRVLPLDRIDARVEVAALPVGDLQELFGIPARVTGSLWTTAEIEGPGTAPTAMAEFRLENGSIQDVPVQLLEGRLEYASESLVVAATAALDTAGAFIVDARLPVVLRLASDSVGVRFADGGALSGTIQADSVSIAPLGGLSPYVRNLSGRLEGQVRLDGTVSNPLFGGALRLTSGAGTLSLLRQDYTGITADIGFEGRRAVLAPLRLVSDGTATVTGSITFEELTRPVADLTAAFDQFRAVGVPDYDDAAVTGRVAVAGPYDALEVTGSVEVDDGYVPIPEFQSDFADLDDIPGAALPERDDSSNPLLEGLTVRDLQVDVGTNVWFIAEAARAQLGGSLTVNMAGDAFSMTGTLQGERGVYTLEAGPIVRRFQIASAEVRFLGLPEPDPAIDITATKTMFDPSGRQVEISVAVTGSLRAPVLSLASADAPTIPESELLSFLFFGRPSTELGGAGLPGEALLEDAFLGGLAELATLELEETLIEDLGLSLDIFQVRFGPGGIGGFGAPAFVFGWELGSNVFLTAESAIGALTEGSEAAANAWAIRIEWAFDPKSRLRAGLEPVARGRFLRGLSLALPSVRPRQQFSLELRRRWNY